MEERLLEVVEETARVLREFVSEEKEKIVAFVKKVKEAIEAGNKILIFGNGGSAADAQHFAAELVNRFLLDRSPLPAVALTTDTSILTAVGNDYGFDLVFVKQVEALGKKGDIALGISTSGRSPNVLKALKRAKELGLFCVGLTGKKGTPMKEVCDLVITVPSEKTPRIQEGHLFFLHIVSELIEKTLFEENRRA